MGQPLRLVVVLYRHAAGVEEHQHYHKPVKPLRLHGVSDPEAKSFLRPPKALASALGFHFRFEISCN